VIVLGTTGVTYPKGGGSFRCPACARERPYRRKRIRRFFTVYFVPLVPLDLIAEFVECRACRGRFKVAVIGTAPPTGCSRGAGR